MSDASVSANSGPVTNEELLRRATPIRGKEIGMAQAPSLIRTKSVLKVDTSAGADRAGKPFGELIRFLSDDDGEDGTQRPVVQLARETWDDMGQPAALTVAIWPGDRQDIMEGNLSWTADDSAEQVG